MKERFWEFLLHVDLQREREEQEDIMGCCSGRCTLAFICGMQLVSVCILIDLTRGTIVWVKSRKSSTNRQVLMGTKRKESLAGAGAEVERWVDGGARDELLKGHISEVNKRS